MDRITALIRLSATQYLGRWRTTFALRPGLVLFEGAAIAWLAIRYLRFLGHLSSSLDSQDAKLSVSVVLVILGSLASAPILAMMRQARENPRWRLLPLNRGERILTSAFQYFFQLPLVFLVWPSRGQRGSAGGELIRHSGFSGVPWQPLFGPLLSVQFTEDLILQGVS